MPSVWCVGRLDIAPLFLPSVTLTTVCLFHTACCRVSLWLVLVLFTNISVPLSRYLRVHLSHLIQLTGRIDSSTCCRLEWPRGLCTAADRCRSQYKCRGPCAYRTLLCCCSFLELYLKVFFFTHPIHNFLCDRGHIPKYSSRSP